MPAVLDLDRPGRVRAALITLLVTLPLCVRAEPPVEAGVADRAEPQEPRAVIRFVDLGGIRDWRPDGSDAILIQGQNGRWFRATFFGSCPRLRFVDSIGFVTDASGSLDKFSSLLVDGEQCWFRTLEQVREPDLPAPDEARPKPTEREE